MLLTHEQESSDCFQSRFTLGICSTITTTLVIFMLVFLKGMEVAASGYSNYQML